MSSCIIQRKQLFPFKVGIEKQEGNSNEAGWTVKTLRDDSLENLQVFFFLCKFLFLSSQLDRCRPVCEDEKGPTAFSANHLGLFFLGFFLHIPCSTDIPNEEI